MTKRRLSQDEQRIWQQVTRSVRPIDELSRRERSKPDADLPTAPAGPAKPARPLPPVRAGHADRTQERKVKRGKVEIAARLDLHGHTQSSAWQIVPGFLRREQARGARAVIIITGKGRPGGGVLRQNFLRWLEMPEARSLVSSYTEAHPKHGGAGAWYVFLRKP